MREGAEDLEGAGGRGEGAEGVLEGGERAHGVGGMRWGGHGLSRGCGEACSLSHEGAVFRDVVISSDVFAIAASPFSITSGYLLPHTMMPTHDDDQHR